MKPARVTVEVVLARPERQTVQRLLLPAGSTVGDALAASDLPAEFRKPESGRVGIYGQAVATGTVLRDGDRVEIYRSLRADPKDLRRARAAKKGAKA
jgi:putative ubiquitin-RnfH superfamily antitoxin RatB of RatAB toxin-antitoxin module